MDSVLNAAVIGCGAIARKKHIPLAAANPHVHIKALCSRSRAPAEVCKAELGCADAAVYGNAEETTLTWSSCVRPTTPTRTTRCGQWRAEST